MESYYIEYSEQTLAVVDFVGIPMVPIPKGENGYPHLTFCVWAGPYRKAGLQTVIP
jgi:hypothetical protein